MKAPITGNSITERVQFTGLYVPEPTWHTEAEEDAPATPVGAEWEPLEAA